MRQVLQANGSNPLNQVILKGFETLTVQNVLLKAEIDGLKQTVTLQKKRGIRSKNLFKKIIDEDRNRAIWFSPVKITRARELQQEKEEAEEQAQQEKEERALQRLRAKEKKELQLQEKRAQREEARLERERLKALKQATQKEARTQRKVE